MEYPVSFVHELMFFICWSFWTRRLTLVSFYRSLESYAKYLLTYVLELFASEFSIYSYLRLGMINQIGVSIEVDLLTSMVFETFKRPDDFFLNQLLYSSKHRFETILYKVLYCNLSEQKKSAGIRKLNVSNKKYSPMIELIVGKNETVISKADLFDFMLFKLDRRIQEPIKKQKLLEKILWYFAWLSILIYIVYYNVDLRMKVKK